MAKRGNFGGTISSGFISYCNIRKGRGDGGGVKKKEFSCHCSFIKSSMNAKNNGLLFVVRNVTSFIKLLLLFWSPFQDYLNQLSDLNKRKAS